MAASRPAALRLVLWLVLAWLPLATAQFGNIFEQMFGGGGGHGHGHQHHQHQQQHQQQQQNVPSDSEWYRKTYNGAFCDKYLCPDTLACVHFPHHCPCQWPDNEDKVELGEGIAICGSKGGYREDEFARKIELARKGLL